MWNADVKVIVFDIGGTLMEYRGIPNVWTDYYQTAFEHVRQSLKLKLRDESMHLSSYIYPETISELKRLKAHGTKIATFTDVITRMPDELHKSFFMELQPYFDLYVSSLSCGYRKPNPKKLTRYRRIFRCTSKRNAYVWRRRKRYSNCKNIWMQIGID